MNQKLPKHIAIIMDGNGRWAVQRGLSRVEGHRAGLETVRMVLKACEEKDISVLSLFAFSTENWSRPPEEVNYLMQLFIEVIEKEFDELMQKGIVIRFIGDRANLPELVRLMMESTENVVIPNPKFILNIVLNYGGRWDIVNAAKKIASDVKNGVLAESQIDEALFSTYLSTHSLPDPDLLIRTSGELRISNFFLWQLAYSELYFSEAFWPDFTLDDFEKALDYFTARKRRYGKTSQQCDEAPYV